MKGASGLWGFRALGVSGPSGFRAWGSEDLYRKVIIRIPPQNANVAGVPEPTDLAGGSPESTQILTPPDLQGYGLRAKGLERLGL